jgi:hypothetical protein
MLFVVVSACFPQIRRRIVWKFRRGRKHHRDILAAAAAADESWREVGRKRALVFPQPVDHRWEIKRRAPVAAEIVAIGVQMQSRVSQGPKCPVSDGDQFFAHVVSDLNMAPQPEKEKTSRGQTWPLTALRLF